MSVVKPEKKQKHDGAVDLMFSDEARFIVMRGDYTAERMLQAAVEQSVISPDHDDWKGARYYQTWYKSSPIGGQGGYSRWNHPRDTPCRGAYFASVLEWD
ncbi:MAG: hypothetical protein PW844_18975 [Pantoea sp.]|uniref:hypothetical protein n=1 Tax=Pantoea sp. TaxID=69393 RepID=UPI00239A3D66|nr:hypothetical protein [Pantoea sp.]MDE1188532.1 hypothetical protein [Pantoea sp.]